MRRDASEHLDTWLTAPGRRPLVLRGARQVGKTWLVRDLAERHGLDLVECNPERDASAARCLAPGASPRRVLADISLLRGRDVEPGRSLLFLDEIQARPEALGMLRWFAEEMPDLAVVVAGSLLEFVLADHAFAMPVGRIAYVHVGPLSFVEYAEAHGQSRLLARLAEWRPGSAAPGDAAMERGGELWTRFVMTGGMPAVVASDVEAGPEPDAAAGRAVRRLQSDLAATYRDDFAKYRRRADPHLLDAVLRSVVRQLGQPFVLSHVEDGTSHRSAGAALALLARAGLCRIVRRTDANGVPLGAESDDRVRKVLLLDVGLAHALLDTPPGGPRAVWDRFPPALRGQLAEQAVGQEICALREPWSEPSLHFWHRGGGRPGEVDFVLAIDGRVVPLEVKSGRAGSMKSLHQFMHDKGLGVAVRCDENPPSVQDVVVRTTRGDPVSFRLLSVPPWMVWRVPELVRGIVG